MDVLLIGSGGREHAIAWKLKQSPMVTNLYCAPGNAGISSAAECVDIKADDIDSLLKFAIDNKIDLTVVGPEVPLEKGITDLFNKNGLKIFGPQKDAAMLEHSKVFAKDFMKRHNISTAAYNIFNIREKDKLLSFLNETKFPVVLKADGLAAGKGVIICNSFSESELAVKEFFEDKIFGSASNNIVVEDFLEGVEASIFAICDGTDFIILPSSQDHKKINDGDTGKNTGGMGAYSPANKAVTPEVLNKVTTRIIEPVLKNMKAEGKEFKGCLYCGLMIDKNGDPFVIEFNTRFGDPETQAVIPKIKSDLCEMFLASANGNLKNYNLETDDNFYCTVVLASKGYPDKYDTGMEIKGLENIANNELVFHAGTKSINGKIFSSGGRVLNATGSSGVSLLDAINSAYHIAEKLNFQNKYYRNDIGKKGL